MADADWRMRNGVRCQVRQIQFCIYRQKNIPGKFRGNTPSLKASGGRIWQKTYKFSSFFLANFTFQILFIIVVLRTHHISFLQYTLPQMILLLYHRRSCIPRHHGTVVQCSHGTVVQCSHGTAEQCSHLKYNYTSPGSHFLTGFSFALNSQYVQV